jgi:serine protease Do
MLARPLGVRHRALRVAALVLSVVLVGSCASMRAGRAAEGRRICDEPVPDIFDRVAPSVVFIAAMGVDPYRLADRVTRVVGSGVVLDATGLILTNSHVVFGRQSVMVTLDDGTTVPGDLVGADPIFDIALLRVPVLDGAKLVPAPFGDSDRLRVGEEVVAIGNPLDLDQTLTRGVVSALNRILPETPFSLQEPLIQTDAPINPGNSGGPLVNRCGEVVGINTAVMPDAQSIGFAIPSNLVRATVRSLLENGRVVRPWVGFHGTLVGAGLRDLLRLPLVPGLLIEVVEPGSPADKAGLRGGQLELSLGGKSVLVGGDIVTELNGSRLASPDELARAMRPLAVGTRLRLTVFRDGDYRSVEYDLPERPLLPSDVATQRAFRAPVRRPFEGPSLREPTSR